MQPSLFKILKISFFLWYFFILSGEVVFLVFFEIFESANVLENEFGGHENVSWYFCKVFVDLS